MVVEAGYSALQAGDAVTLAVDLGEAVLFALDGSRRLDAAA